MRGRWATALATGFVVAASLAAVSSAGQTLAPGDLTAARGPHSVRADLGSYCISSEPTPGEQGQALCADVAAPTEPPRPRLPVSGGRRVRLKLADRAGVRDDPRRVTVELMRFDRDGADFLPGRLEPRTTGQRSWVVRLPARLRGAEAMHVFVRLSGGDASYTVGLR